MKLAVLSGKGGTGKTFAAVNLAAVSGKAVYIDCDVEEPNGRLFFRPTELTTETVSVRRPVFDAEKCVGCRKCVDLCRFNALVYVRERPMVFSEVCHSCGGCALVCPAGAVSEQSERVGSVECGVSGSVRVVTGCMDPGVASGISIIDAALAHAGAPEELTVLDCPPGSACPVMESVKRADRCLIVAEPTAFGLHNFKMVHELASILGKPCGVLINKTGEAYEPLEAYCAEHELPVLCRIPYSGKLARMGADALIASERDSETAEIFRDLLAALTTEVSA